MHTLAIIGKGKTGGEVLKLLSPTESPLIFDQSHPVSVAALKEADAAIVFVPGAGVSDLIAIVLESQIPTVWGSTGFAWPQDLNQKLVQANTRWVIASNFSPMMVIIQKMLTQIKLFSPQLLPQLNCEIEEVHHLHKKDQPSGTALAWQEWVGLPCSIHSERTGDVKGIHTLKLSSDTETMTVHHEVQDRSVFAQGAIWAARYLLEHPELAPGLYSFYNLVEHSLQEV